MNLGLNYADEDKYALITLSGEVDVYSAPELRTLLLDLLTQGKTNIIVDLEESSFLDSTGLGVLVGGLKRSRSQDGDLKLICTQKNILKVFEVTGLNNIFHIYPSIEEASK